MKKILYTYKLKEDYLPRIGTYAIIESDELAKKLVKALNDRHSYILDKTSDHNYRIADVDIMSDSETLKEIEKQNEREFLRITVTIWTLDAKDGNWSAVVSTQEVKSELKVPLVTQEQNFIEVIFTEHEKYIPVVDQDRLRRYLANKALNIIKNKGIQINQILEVY